MLSNLYRLVMSALLWGSLLLLLGSAVFPLIFPLFEYIEVTFSSKEEVKGTGDWARRNFQLAVEKKLQVALVALLIGLTVFLPDISAKHWGYEWSLRYTTQLMIFVVGMNKIYDFEGLD